MAGRQDPPPAPLLAGRVAPEEHTTAGSQCPPSACPPCPAQAARGSGEAGGYKEAGGEHLAEEVGAQVRGAEEVRGADARARARNMSFQGQPSKSPPEHSEMSSI